METLSEEGKQEPQEVRELLEMVATEMLANNSGSLTYASEALKEKAQEVLETTESVKGKHLAQMVIQSYRDGVAYELGK